MSLSPSLRQFLFVALALTFFGFICWVIFLANTGTGNVFVTYLRELRYGDKLGHVVLYGLLALLVNPALGHRQLRLFAFAIPLGSLLVFSFAVVEECTQIAITTRTFEWADIGCDLVGISLASWLGQGVRNL